MNDLLVKEWEAYVRNITRGLHALITDIEHTASEEDISHLRRTGEIISTINWSVGNLRLGALVRRAERILEVQENM